MSAANPSPELLAAAARSGADYKEGSVESCNKAYVRARDIGEHIAISQREIQDETIEGTALVIGRLLEVAANLAKSGAQRAGHYERNRHIAILGALRAERAKLAHLQNIQGLVRIVGGCAA